MTSTESWPPPPTTERPWHPSRQRISGETRAVEVQVREVRLWGRDVLIDEDHAVYCDDCSSFPLRCWVGSTTRTESVC
jgi:hypothetical protein